MTDAPNDADDTSTDTTTETTTDAPDTEALQAELDKWKAAARKHEDRAKANKGAADELEKLRQQSMTDQERAVAEARVQARAETLKEVGAERVDDLVRVAVTGRNIADVDALLEGIDRARFLDDEGQPDRVAIQQWIDRVAPAPSEEEQDASLDLGQGTRTPAMALNGDPLLRQLKRAVGAT